MSSRLQPLIQRLACAGCDAPERTVLELAAQVVGCKPLDAFFQPLSEEQSSQLEPLICRAEQGEPLQYIVGHVDFRGLHLLCDRRALIPRPETELLVEAALESVGPERNQPLRIVDVGTGSGCIALALLASLPQAVATGIDRSAEALSLAVENSATLGLADRFHPLHGDLLEPLFTADPPATFDLLTANLPYIRREVCASLPPSVRNHEPHAALDGGPDGLDLIRRLLIQVPRVLASGARLFLEIGYDQGPDVLALLRQAGFHRPELRQDHNGLDRIVCANVPEPDHPVRNRPGGMPVSARNCRPK